MLRSLAYLLIAANSSTEIALPDPARVSKWSDDYKEKLTKAREEIERYNLIRNQLNKAIQLTRRNEYALSVLKQINELQIYPAKLLLLLEKYDRVSSANKESAKKEVQKLVTAFEDVRKNYENVFSQTRILSNPDNYIVDQNQHAHLANGTNNSDWMFVYELAMNKKINDWLFN